MVEAKRRVVIVEDQTLMREGLRVLLSSQGNLEVVGEGADGREAIRLAEELKPDLMLLALALPRFSGMESMKELRRVSPRTRIVAMGVERTEECIVSALQAGAYAYVPEDSSSVELFMAIRCVLAGERFLSPTIATPAVTRFLEGRKLFAISSSAGELSSREKEILKLVAEGFRTKQIADFLCISPKTVEKHRANLMKKLGLHSIQALTVFAIRKGMVAQSHHPAFEGGHLGPPAPISAKSG